MIYLIYGNQSATIKQRIKKIAKESLGEIDDMNFVRFDGSNTLIQEIIDECNYVPLGYDKKVVIIEDCYFMLKTKGKNKIEQEQDYDSFRDYINNPNPDCDLIISIISSDVDQKSEYYKVISESGKIIALSDPTPEQWNDYVEQYCRNKLGLKIDNDALRELSIRTEGDVANFQNNAKKLALYSDHITIDDVILMVTRPLEDKAYELFNHLVNGKNEKAVSLYRDLRVANTEPVTLISMLSNSFRLMNQIKYLSNRGLSNEAIATQLKQKPGRIAALKRNSGYLSEKTIVKTIDELFDLDLQIKSGLVDRFHTFELFLIKFKRS